MRSRTLILLLSLVANAALLAVWQRARLAPKGEVPATIATASDLKLPATGNPAIPRTISTGSLVPAASAKADWSHIWSPNLKDYVARLRAVGCPEDSVQDIIVAEVKRLFAPRQRALLPDRFDQPVWTVKKFDRKEQLERSRKSRDLDEEQTALLVELLGVDPRKVRNQGSGLGDQESDHLEFLPESKRAAVRKFLDQFDEKMLEVSVRNQGIWDTQTRAESRALEQERLPGLGQILTPEEVRQWELRKSKVARQLQSDLGGFELTEEEYVRLFDVWKKYGDSTYNYSGLEPEEQKAAQLAKEQMKADLRTSLGDTRAREYERSQDFNYRELVKLAEDNGLPAGTAGKIYDAKIAAEAAILAS